MDRWSPYQRLGAPVSGLRRLRRVISADDDDLEIPPAALCAAQRQLDQRHVTEPPPDEVVQVQHVPAVAKPAHGIDTMNVGVVAGGGEFAQLSPE
jgi:hypothetical protein